ncbi:hypothetical protein Tco_1492466 [Tanacetum coccineum]
MKRVNSFVAMNSEAQEISRKKDESSSKKTEIAQDSSAKRAGDKLESDESKKQKTDENEEVKEDNEVELKSIWMLQGIDREDLKTLWKLVKTKHVLLVQKVYAAGLQLLEELLLSEDKDE